MPEDKKAFDPSMFRSFEELLENAPEEAENFKPLEGGGFIRKTVLDLEDAQNQATSEDSPRAAEKHSETAASIDSEIDAAIKKIFYKPEVALQNKVVLGNRQEFNRYLLEAFFEKSQSQSITTSEWFEYVRENIEEFRGLGIWPEGETPYQVFWIIDSITETDGSVEKAVSTLKDVFSLSEQETEKIIIDLYARYCEANYTKGQHVLNALQQELPLSGDDRLKVMRSFLSSKLKSFAKNYLDAGTKKYDEIERNRRDYEVSSMIERPTSVAKRNLSVESDPFDNPEVVVEGRNTLKAMLNSEIPSRVSIPQIAMLHKIAPAFFQGDFGEEIAGLWDRVPDSYFKESFPALLKSLNYSIEETRPLARKTLLKKLPDINHPIQYPEGLITYMHSAGMSDLLSDPEILDAAREGRREILQNPKGDLFPDFSLFIKISQDFGFSEDWKADPELSRALKTGILKKLEGHFDDKNFEQFNIGFGIDFITGDPDLKSVLEEAILDNRYRSDGFSTFDRWGIKLEAFTRWGLDIEKLHEQVKQFLFKQLSESDDSRLHDIGDCIRAFPEIWNLPEFQKMATERILGWKYEASPDRFDTYFKLGATIQEIEQTIRSLRLPPELLDQWKINVSTRLLADVSNQDELEKLQKFKFLPDGLGSVALDAALISLSQGELGNTLFLETQFSIKFAEADAERLQEAGEAGLPIALQQGNLQSVIRIQEMCHLSPEFFEQSEIRDKICQLLADQFLSKGEIEELENRIALFGLPSDMYSILDTQVGDNDNLTKNLLRFVKYLGDENITSKFPQTFKHARETIFANLTGDQDLADYFVENLDKYYQQPWIAEYVTRAIQQYSIAEKFIDDVQSGQTVWGNEPWVSSILAKAKVIVEEHQKQSQQGDEWQVDSYEFGHGNEGFRESDPYEKHQWRFDEKQAQITLLLSSAINGDLTAIKELDEILQKAGIDSEKVNLSLSEIYEKLNASYKNFLSQIRLNPNINDEDKQALLDPGLMSVRMTPLIDNVRSFVARYLVQSVEGDISRLSGIGSFGDDLDRILAEGFQKYIKIHEIDVPLYDKLYEEFDNLRETGRYPLEVYLGRDGIYAWIGRRAQDVARRRKIGLEGRKKLKEMGEVLEINPQYTVYPRYFRDYLDYETKRKFLEQERISPDTDPLFYDTGYKGTIPEQIMKVMDFDQEDIEQRIRLLSAPSVHRRIKGVSENARSEIIEYIEHNAKTEEVAEGLIIDERTGKIHHIARPTNPEEQFYFMMVKQAIARHYWLQEQLHHEPSGNVNLDSEHFSIRIRQDYAKLLPQEFMHDPKAFFAQHGELMKGSKGEGEYPDEEIILFKLTDGTEIVAKRIELRKAKEVRKEFTILIAAKKAGLPTAEPVGFLSGKEDDDGSYLLMKKVEGRSGRHFEKELRESGKYSDEQIGSIMQTVAEKNKEMVELFRATLQIDKRWRIKDTIIEFNEETGEVESVIPIDWERVQNYDAENPKEIDEIT